MVYRYAVVCGWKIRYSGSLSHTKGHSGLLIIETEEPWDGVTFPQANRLGAVHSPCS